VQEIAEVYARSLFEVAQEQGKLKEVHEQLGQFADELDSNREMQMYFFSPYFSSEEKKDGVAKVLEGADDYFVRFLELLAERHRLPAVFRIRRQFDAMWAEEQNLLPVRITSAVELDSRTTKDIGKRIEEQTGRTVELSSDVDPEVLGGLVIRVGNMVMDTSVRSRLERVRREVLRAA
jgi:F-type H+-transporting ATPase subunit delta